MRNFRALLVACWVAMVVGPVWAAPSSVPVRDVVDQVPLRTDGRPITAEMLKKAIILGGATKGWVVSEEGPGQLRASIDVRGKHQAMVGIRYGDNRYSIQYRSANNLNVEVKNADQRYDATTQAMPNGTVLIHPNYNRWIGNLVQAIDAAANVVEP